MIQDKLPEIELSFGTFGVRQPTLRGWNDLLAEAEETIGLETIKDMLSKIANAVSDKEETDTSDTEDVSDEKESVTAIEDDEGSGLFGKTMTLLMEHIQQFPLLVEKFACVCLRDLETRKPITRDQGEDLTVSDFADLIEFICANGIFSEMVEKVKNVWGRLLVEPKTAASEQKDSSE